MKNRIAENVAIDGNMPNKILLKTLPLYQILTKNEGAFLSFDLKNLINNPQQNSLKENAKWLISSFEANLQN